MPRLAPQKISSNYFAALSKDVRFKKIMEAGSEYKPKKAVNLPLFLYSTIIMQQLSGKAGDIIFQRFLDLFESKTPTPEEVAAISIKKYRSAGLSNSKAAYIKNVAEFATKYGLDHKSFKKMSDEEVIEHLTSIKGIGRWTAHIFLMSALAREDVFPIGDLVIQKAMAALYKLDHKNKKKFLEDIHRISAKWSPYRTYASRYLWRWYHRPSKSALDE